MADYYYQIKARDNSEHAITNWAWPPLFSGKVSANSKNQAKAAIEDEYGRKFPLRVLSKDLEQNHYLLFIQEIAESDERIKKLFDLNECKECGCKFRRIDLYNDHNEIYKGSEYCGYQCKTISIEKNKALPTDISGNCKPVIYKITNSQTGMSYIGKTTQVFTLRWYQHFFQGGSCKFHSAIKESNISDWEFKIVEIVEIPDSISDKDAFIIERERFWINSLNTINNGYNSL